jgi:outer membrane protein assembly factor BamB
MHSTRLPSAFASLRTRLAIAFLLGLFATSPAWGENWSRFRGPTGYGVTSETDFPLTWNGKTGEGVLWKAPLKGPTLATTGHSSPVVWGDRVFLTMSDKQTRMQEEAKEIPEHHVACFQVKDGKELWRTKIAPGKEVAGYNIYATPTPVTDGKTVFVWFASGVLAAVDFDGKLLWRQERPGPFSLNPGLCSSPILYGDTLILMCDQNRQLGYLQGINKKDGSVKWQQKRDKTGACNSTPILLEVKGKTQLVIAGQNILQGLNPENGEPIWWCKSWGFGASPAYAKGLLYVDKGGNEPAQLVDPTGEGDVTKTHVKWKSDKVPGDYSSPVISGDIIYRVKADGVLNAYSLDKGEELFSERLDGFPKVVSPVALPNGHIYFVCTDKSYVVKAGPTLEILATNSLGGGRNTASPAFADGKIYTRDFEFLYCLGKK